MIILLQITGSRDCFLISYLFLPSKCLLSGKPVCEHITHMQAPSQLHSNSNNWNTDNMSITKMSLRSKL